MEAINGSCFVFQADSDAVRRVYETQDNYLIEFDANGNKDTCAIYFSSHDIYYPNNEEIFTKRIVNKNFFEWYHIRISRAGKHIFVRDVFKQWYLTGINARIDTPQKLTEFLTQETKGYKSIICIGSSAGGYAAILHGSKIAANTVIVFSPRFEMTSLLSSSSESIAPLLFRLKDKRKEYLDVVPHINGETEIFYFHPTHSQLDIKQGEHAPNMANVWSIPFNSRHHGIPFLKVALPKVLNMEATDLRRLANKTHYPIPFTIKMAGLRKTVTGFFQQIYRAYKKRK